MTHQEMPKFKKVEPHSIPALARPDSVLEDMLEAVQLSEREFGGWWEQTALPRWSWVAHFPDRTLNISTLVGCSQLVEEDSSDFTSCFLQE